MISAVAHRDLKDSLLVRARVKAHLESFLGDREHEIETNDSADYRYRVVIPRILFATLLSEQASYIDYDNFKGRVDSLPQKAYARLLHTVWQSVYNALAKIR